MRLFYCDPGLASDLGHHAHSCRVLVGEARRRGIETRVFGASDLEPRLQQELGAQPLFRVSPYWRSDGDPICGWLTAFGIAVQATVEDFRTLDAELRPEDVLYVNSGQAAQLMALASWIAAAPLPARAVIEFGVDPGLDLKMTPTGLKADVRDPRLDASGVLYRYAAKQVTGPVLARLRLATFDPASSDAYGKLMDRPVGTLPVPRGRELPVQTRAPGAPITVSVLGHQRREKGYQFVPEIFAKVASQFPDGSVRFLAHNGQPDFVPDAQAALRQLAAADPRVILDERVADSAIWLDLLRRSDVILCPYDPHRFAISYSAVASEAIAHGIPLVVPAGTTLHRSMTDFGAGTAFPQWNPQAITSALEQAIRAIDALTTQATAGAEKWAQHHGPAHCLDALLRIAGGG